MHGRTSVLAVLPLPRHRESAAADLAASHRALAAPILLIERARTYAPSISMGAVAGFVRFSVASTAGAPGPGGRLVALLGGCSGRSCNHLPSEIIA